MTIIYGLPEQKIRLKLLESPGAQVCLIERTKTNPGCQVITQGGQKGLTEHRKVCHVSEQWVK